MSTSSSVKFYSVQEFVAKFNIETLRLVLNTKTDKVSVLLNEGTENQEFLPISGELQENHSLMEDNADSLRFIVPVTTDKRGREILDYQSACMILPKPGSGESPLKTFMSFNF